MYPRRGGRAAIGTAAVLVAGALYAYSRPGEAPKAETEEEYQLRKLRHWEEGKRKRDELIARHDAEHERELAALEARHPGSIAHLQELAARRAEMKKYEVKLMQDRHAMGAPHMGGKTKSWSDMERDKRAKIAEHDQKMLEEATRLKDQLAKS